MRHKNNISFRLVAYTDAAGKYDPDAVRSGNEDNFYVDDDLTDNVPSKVAQDEIIQLGDFGMLMVVADGMGGMNAGEVASQLAIDTVRELFTPNIISKLDVESSQTRQKYLDQVIKTADKKIKTEARKDRSREGMGSTIILAWLYGNELIVSWCGDSRAYIFNEKSGIRLISQDHSYVQELVNKGLLTYDQTFDHPQNNIITRSLGDPTKDARPESKIVKVGKGDIILLCSDGLSGVLRDRKTYDSNGILCPEDNLEDIIRSNTDSMKVCREALWTAAEQGGWYDNVTAILCQITEGPESEWASHFGTAPEPCPGGHKGPGLNKNRVVIFGLLGLIIIGAIVGAFFIGKGTQDPKELEGLPTDSISQEVVDTVVSKEETNEEIEQSPESDKKSEVEQTSTISEKVSAQAKAKEESKDSVPTEKKNVLTKIKGDKEAKTSDNPVLTPIKDKNKEVPTHFNKGTRGKNKIETNKVQK